MNDISLLSVFDAMIDSMQSFSKFTYDTKPEIIIRVPVEMARKYFVFTKSMGNDKVTYRNVIFKIEVV